MNKFTFDNSKLKLDTHIISDSQKDGLKVNYLAISAISGILFFVIAHPFIFNLVDKLISKIFRTDSLPRDLLVLIHSIVFSIFMFIFIYFIVNFL